MKKLVKVMLVVVVILLIASFFVYRTKVFKKETQTANKEVKTKILEPIEKVEVEILNTQTGSAESSDSVIFEPKTPEQDLGSIDQIPSELIFNVPFTPQAPFANWDMPYQEACEEAAMIMVAKYFKKENLNKQIMDEEILKLIAWEEENNYSIDLTAEQIVEVIQKYFSLNAYTDTETNVHNIKDLLNQEKLIIIPAAGRQLGNPYFRTPGPLYHNLVIIGYDDDEFVTNDPGTKRGQEYKYKYFDLINAIHDWPLDSSSTSSDSLGAGQEADMNKGRKVMVIVSP